MASNILAPYYPDVFRRAESVAAKCNITPELSLGKDYGPKPVVDSVFIRRCAEAISYNKKILLVGDSFAQLAMFHMDIIAQNIGYEFRAIFGYECPYPLQLEEIRSSAIRTCPHIDEKRLWDDIVRYINRGDVLVIRLYMPSPRYVYYSNRELPPADAYDEAISRIANEVVARGARGLSR
jgi:hypothetical protein